MKRFFRALVPALLIAAPLAAAAQIKLLPPCTATGDCGVTDILAVFINVAEYLLGISGAVALGFFVYGGFVYVLSRGKPEEVKKASGILTSAVIGIVIIFLSGVLIRFTTQALTGGVSAIPTVGESCDTKTKKSVKTGDACGASGSCAAGTKCNKSSNTCESDGLWVSIPAGRDDNSAIVPEGLVCIAKDDCKSLNKALTDRHRPESYACIPVSGASSCVRGLCLSQGADYACCIGAAPATTPQK